MDPRVVSSWHADLITLNTAHRLTLKSPVMLRLKKAVVKTDKSITSELLGQIIKSSDVEQKGQCHLIQVKIQEMFNRHSWILSSILALKCTKHPPIQGFCHAGGCSQVCCQRSLMKSDAYKLLKEALLWQSLIERWLSGSVKGTFPFLIPRSPAPRVNSVWCLPQVLGFIFCCGQSLILFNWNFFASVFSHSCSI